MNANQHAEKETPLERGLFFIVRAVLGLILFPVVTLLVAMGLTWIQVAVGLSESHEARALVFVTISGAIVGLATSAFIVWKSGNASCIEFSIVGALLIGGVMLAGILFLGHARPSGWNFDRILPSMGLGFAIFSSAGYRLDLLEGGEEADDGRRLRGRWGRRRWAGVVCFNVIKNQGVELDAV